MPQSTESRSHIGVYVYGSGAFGDKARPKDKSHAHKRTKKVSRPCCSINSFETVQG